MLNTRKSIGDAVKAGVIDEGASPYLRKGYRVANLNVLSARYAAELNQALTARKLYTNGDAAAIESFTEQVLCTIFKIRMILIVLLQQK